MIIKAGMWDKMQYIFRNYYDRMMHGCLYFDGKLDENILKEALAILVKKVPVLHSKYVPNPIAPFWKAGKEVDVNSFFTFEEACDGEAAASQFLNGSFSAKSAYQLRAKLIRCGKKDILCLLVNHMCFDGGDLKYFVKKLAECYNNIKEKGLRDVEVKSGARTSIQAYSSMSEEDRKKARTLFKNASIVKEKVKFPFAEPENDKNMIVKKKIDEATFLAAKSEGKKRGATLNDIILAAYFRAFYRISERDASLPLSIPNMIDLRRHIASGDTAGLTNMTGLFVCRIEQLGKDIFQTVENVKAALEKIKQDKFIGLHGPPLLHLAFAIFPNFFAEFCIKLGYSNPLIGMSNIGIIDDKAIKFSGAELCDAFLTGATKFKPYIQLALTTFKNVITLTVAVRANQNDKVKIEKFLGFVEEELKIFAAGQN